MHIMDVKYISTEKHGGGGGGWRAGGRGARIMVPRVFDCPRRPRHRRVPDRWDEIRGAGGNVLWGFCRQVRRNNPELDAHPTAPVKRAGVAADPLARPPFFARAHAHADV